LIPIKTLKSAKYGTKTKHITIAKNTLNLINTKANPRNTILKETDTLSSYKDKKYVTVFNQNIRGSRGKTNELY
jgi:hypothetical protein